MIGRVVILRGKLLNGGKVPRGRVRDTATVYDAMHEKLTWYFLVEQLDADSNCTGDLAVWEHTDVIVEGAT